MPDDGSKVRDLADRRRAERLLSAIAQHEQQVQAPAARLLLEVDGERLEPFDHHGGQTEVELPMRARSVALRDEAGRMRAFRQLDESELAESLHDRGRLALSVDPTERGLLRLRVATVEPVSAGRSAQTLEAVETRADARAVAAVAAPVSDGLGAQVIESRLERSNRRLRLLLAAAATAVVLSGGLSAGLWYRYDQARADRQAAEERERVAREASARKAQELAVKLAEVERLRDKLAAAPTPEEREELLRKLRRAEEDAVRARGRAGAPSRSDKPAKAACRPGDPLCSDM